MQKPELGFPAAYDTNSQLILYLNIERRTSSKLQKCEKPFISFFPSHLTFQPSSRRKQGHFAEKSNRMEQARCANERTGVLV
jgi:hypothetical protein